MGWFIVRWLLFSTFIYVPIVLWSNLEASGHCFTFSPKPNCPALQEEKFIKNRRFSYIVFPSLSLILGLPISLLNIRAEWPFFVFLSAVFYLMAISAIGLHRLSDKDRKRKKISKQEVYPVLIIFSLIVAGIITKLVILLKECWTF